MLLEEYQKEIFRPRCNPSFQTLHCIAHLGRDISDVLPYLNTALGGCAFTIDPPSVTFKIHGKLITIHSEQIAINALKDEEEADKILEWLRKEINETWEKREKLKPSFQGISKPQILEVLKFLPRTNCRKCGQTTCMVFAFLVTDGVKEPEDCPGITAENKAKLVKYLEPFPFEP